MTLLKFITNLLEPFSYLLYLIGILIHYRHTRWRSQKWLGVYYFLATILMIITTNIFSDETTNNIWAYNVSAVVAAVCIGVYFHQLLQSNLKKWVVVCLLSGFLLYAFIKNIIMKDFGLFDSMGYSYVSASVAVYVMMYFHQLLSHVTDTNLFRQFNFWLASGYLIYFMGSFIIFLSYYYFTKKILSTYTSEERDLLTTLWGVHNMLLFVSALSLLLVSLWLTYQKKSASS